MTRIAIVLLLSGCGQQGDLYYPEKEPTQESRVINQPQQRQSSLLLTFVGGGFGSL